MMTILLKRRCLLPAALLLCCTVYSTTGSAQFWKRKEDKARKGKYTNKYPVKPVAKNKPKAEKQKKSRELSYPPTVKKDHYRIDILLPLYLDELVKNNKPAYKGKVPEKSAAALAFYEGVRLAADTLAHSDRYHADIYVHDIGAANASVEKLLAKDSLKETDLILGFVPTQNVTALAKYAKEKQVNFVSLFSPSDAGIRDNPYFILLNPTLKSHSDFIVSSIEKKYPRQNIILYKRSKVSLDSTACSYFTEGDELKHLVTIDCDQVPDSAYLDSLFDKTAMNVLLMPVMDNTYAEVLLKQLKNSFPDHNFDVYGMPSWKSVTATKKMTELGEHISVNITQPYYFDPTVSSGQVLAAMYRKAFGGKPSELSYRGFESVYWFTDLLSKYGTIFNQKTNDDGMAIFTRFDLKPKWDKENNFYYTENRHLCIYHYQGGTVLVEQ